MGDPWFDTPFHVDSISGAVGVAAGFSHSCAVLIDGTIWCWGSDIYGKLGNGSAGSGSDPVQVVGITTAMTIAAGLSHTCALLGDGTAWCWGAGGWGQLGAGTTTSSNIPVQVLGLAGVVQLPNEIWDHTCAVLGNGSAWCWGMNTDGQLGDGTTLHSSIPVLVLDPY